jgi:hypothetical protein
MVKKIKEINTNIMEFRKNAIDLTDLAIGIVVIGIVVSIGASILNSYQSSRLTDLTQYTTTNETTFINQTTDKLANAWGKSVSICWGDWNQTILSTNNPAGYNVSIPSSNYTATVSDLNGLITLQNSTAKQYPNASCTYVSYNTTSRSDYTLAGDAATGLSEYGNWFDIIVIVGIAAVILALIFMAFGRGSEFSSVSGSY